MENALFGFYLGNRLRSGIMFERKSSRLILLEEKQRHRRQIVIECTICYLQKLKLSLNPKYETLPSLIPHYSPGFTNIVG
jgi:hypothetical protein